MLPSRLTTKKDDFIKALKPMKTTHVSRCLCTSLILLFVSIVEVFVNGKQCVAVRVHPGREDSVGVSIKSRSQDARLVSLDAWRMRSIYE